MLVVQNTLSLVDAVHLGHLLNTTNLRQAVRLRLQITPWIVLFPNRSNAPHGFLHVLSCPINPNGLKQNGMERNGIKRSNRFLETKRNETKRYRYIVTYCIYCTLCVPYTVSVSGINLMYWDLSNPATAGNSDHVCSDWSLKPACVVVPCVMVWCGRGSWCGQTVKGCTLNKTCNNSTP